MKKKILLAGLTVTCALAVACTGVLMHNNPLVKASGTATERTITFQNQNDVVSSGGSTFYLSANEYKEPKNLVLKSSYLGDLLSYGLFQINCRETNGIAKFSLLTKIKLTYKVPGPESNMVEIYVGDAETESFEGAQKYYANGTNYSEHTEYFYIGESVGTNSIIKIRNSSAFKLEMTSLSITYKC